VLCLLQTECLKHSSVCLKQGESEHLKFEPQIRT
jgi:hypothetical protein